MNYPALFREIIGQQLPTLFLQVEEDLLNYLKEYLLSKINKEPEFFDAQVEAIGGDFTLIPKKMVFAFTEGLQSIGISPIVTLGKFNTYFREISPDPKLATPSMWIYERFRPLLRILLVDELIHFFEGMPGNIVDKFYDFDILPPSEYDNFKREKENLVKFGQLVRSYNAFRHVLNYVEKIDNLLLFERPQRDLQVLYFILQISNNFGEHVRFNAPHIREFLQRDQGAWIGNTVPINPASPSTILSGITAADVLNINIETAPIFKKQKANVLHLLDTWGKGRDARYFEIYDMLLSLTGNGSVLPPEILERLNNCTISPENLEDDVPLNHIGVQFEIIFLGNPAYFIPNNVQELITKYLEKFRTQDGFAEEAGSAVTHPIATYFGFKILQRAKLLDSAEFKRLFQYFINTCEHLVGTIDYRTPETIAAVFFCSKFFSALERESTYMPLILDFLECNQKRDGTATHITFPDPSKLEEEFQLSRQLNPQEIADIFRNSRKVPDVNNSQRSGTHIPRAILSQIAGQTLATVQVPSQEKPNSLAQALQESDNSTHKDPEPGVPGILSALRALPRLSDAYLERFRVNYRDLVVPPPFLWDSLSRITQYFAVLRMLRVEFKTTSSDILEKTQRYIGSRGFLADNLSREEVTNTFFGLNLFAQFDLLENLPLNKIQDFLVSELWHCVHINAEKAAFCIMGLSIIAPDVTRILEVQALISELDVTKLLIFDEEQKFEEYFYISLLLKAFHFESVLNEARENYHRELAQAINEDGSIGELVSQTSWALLAAQIFGLPVTQIALIDKLSAFLYQITTYFSDDVRRLANWQDEELYFTIELNMLFWALLPLAILHTSAPGAALQIFCPKCGQYFKTHPILCTTCGTKF